MAPAKSCSKTCARSCCAPKGRGGASVTVAEQMSGEGSEQRSGPAEAILARRSSRPEMPGWLLKEGADEEDESGSEYDPAEELPEPDEEAAEYEVDGVVRGRVRLHGSKQSTSGLQVDDERRNSLAERKYKVIAESVLTPDVTFRSSQNKQPGLERQ